MRLPEITYLAPSEEGYTPANKEYCHTPIRESRHELHPETANTLNYGDYFQGITKAISQDGFRRLADATTRLMGHHVLPTEIQEIRIIAEKHGSDYHPARVEVFSGGPCIPFVMNVAVTERGKARLKNEFDVLQHLESKFDYDLIPRVYFQSEVLFQTDQKGAGETRLSMFLADWFEGYHEFHPSIDSQYGTQKVVLWEGTRGKRHLDACQVPEVYGQAAKIMTLYYDLETFKQIYPWHHAAGDFVVKAQNDSILVKLITARQYASMIEPSEKISVWDALLFFLLNLSVRTRLDRLDGVGELVWAGDACVDATVEGFLDGIRIKERQDANAEGLVGGFLYHAMHLNKEDLSNMFHALVDACNPAAPDMPVIKTHLERHIVTFHQALQKRTVPDQISLQSR